MDTKPQSDQEWTIHALNIHGTFFERRCQQIIAGVQGWHVKATNYPVEYPLPNGPLRGEESSLDIRAEYWHGGVKLTLLIECKKNNPDFVDWVFFPKHPQRPHGLVSMKLSTLPNGDSWQSTTELLNINIGDVPIADEGRETKGDYHKIKDDRRDKTKTSNASITEAARQIALATQAIIVEEQNENLAKASHNPPLSRPYNGQIIIPLIVTTAKLSTCTFDVNDIDIATGVIPFDKVTLTEQPYVIYEYPLPRSLQLSWTRNYADLTDEIAALMVRKDILVVNSNYLSSVLHLSLTKIT